MNQIIKRAIEGGFKLDGEEMLKSYQEKGFNPDMWMYLCNPLFWQALGKAEGWEESFGKYQIHSLYDVSCVGGEGDCDGSCETAWTGEVWKYHALRFHEINLTEGWDKAVEYLTNLNQ